MLQAQQVLQDRYRLLQKLGHNAGRQTWLAEDLVHQPARSAIVKLLAFAEPGNWETLKLFQREANILRHLDHPQIPRYLDSFSINDRFLWCGLVQEFIPGNSLQALLSQKKQLSEAIVCQIATAVLHILIYLHELNPPVFHRDIKPSNLIWAEDERIYLIDFGAVQDKAAIERTTFTVVGTYGYAPMEQFGGRTVPASDLYALGATLIHLLVGVAPADLPQRNLKLQFANKIELQPGLIRWLEKMTEPDVANRFETARLAWESLQWTLKTQASSTRVDASLSAIADGRAIVPSGSPATDDRSAAKSRINIHQSSQALEIHLPYNTEAGYAIILGLLFLLKGVFQPSQIVEFAALVATSMFFIGLGFVSSTTSVLVFTHRHFAHYKERNLFSRKRRWLVKEIPLSAIQDVFYHPLSLRAYPETRRNWIVTIRTDYRDYFLGNSINPSGKLSRNECATLVKAIQLWRGLGANA